MSNNRRDQIPEKFYRASIEQTPVFTTGELIDQLTELPRELPVNAGFGEGASVVVYNIDNDAFLILEEPER